MKGQRQCSVYEKMKVTKTRFLEDGKLPLKKRRNRLFFKCFHARGWARWSFRPSVFNVILFSIRQKWGENGQKWFSTSLQAFSLNLSLSICLLITLSQSFFIFLSQSFFHNLSFAIYLKQFFFYNLSFLNFFSKPFFHNHSFTILLLQSLF